MEGWRPSQAPPIIWPHDDIHSFCFKIDSYFPADIFVMFSFDMSMRKEHNR